MRDPFKKVCKEKFKRGAKEHKQTWDNEHIDVVAEIRGELTDLANYSELLSQLNPKLAKKIYDFAYKTWNEMR